MEDLLMRCVAVCRDVLVVKVLHRALASNLDLEFLLDDRAAARRLHDEGMRVRVADPRRVASYLEADVTPATCVIIEDNGRQSLRRILEAVTDAGTTLVYVLRVGDRATSRADAWREAFPDVTVLSLGQLLQESLVTALGRSLTRARVQQYQRYFAGADRVLILLHNDPDPDAMASGLALRNLLHRTKTTAIIGAFQGVTRPENLRMANLLDIKVEPVTAESLARYDLVATVDVQPHYFGGLLDRADLVVDHHPEQSGYTAAFRDIRADYGSTCTILTEHLRAVGANISERTATAMLYAIKSDTLFFSRHTNRVDLAAFTYLYPLADAALVRKMEGAELTLERLTFVSRAIQQGGTRDQVFTAHIGSAPREDLVTYTADFLLQLEDVKWSIISGLVGDAVIVSVRNLGYSRNAGDFVKTCFADVGSAGGHRAMAKAVVPASAFRQKFGSLDDEHVSRLLSDLAGQFLRDALSSERRRESALRGRAAKHGSTSGAARRARRSSDLAG